MLKRESEIETFFSSSEWSEWNGPIYQIENWIQFFKLPSPVANKLNNLSKGKKNNKLRRTLWEGHTSVTLERSIRVIPGMRWVCVNNGTDINKTDLVRRGQKRRDKRLYSHTTAYQKNY